MNTPANNPSPGTIAQQKYSSARSNLLLMIGFTFINIVLLVLDSGTMLLFSATVPYISVLLGMLSESSILLAASVCLTVAIMAAYLLCWLMSKKHYGWMIAALVLFSLDTLVMAGMYLFMQDFSGILDVLIHAWVLYYLIVGVINGHKLKTLPEEHEQEIIADFLSGTEVGLNEPTPVLAETENTPK